MNTRKCNKKINKIITTQNTKTHLGPGLEDGQCFHGSSGLVVQLAGRVPPCLDFGQRGRQELVDAPQVTEVTDNTAGNPGAAHLERRGRGQNVLLFWSFSVSQQQTRCSESNSNPDVVRLPGEYTVWHNVDYNTKLSVRINKVITDHLAGLGSDIRRSISSEGWSESSSNLHTHKHYVLE